MLNPIKKKSLLEQARKLDKSVKQNNLTIDKIVEEVKKVRISRSKKNVDSDNA